MKIKYLGHSCFLMDDLLIDPYIDSDKDKIKCNVICVTHDHSDHIRDAFEIAKHNDAIIVAIHEIAQKASSEGIKSEGMNIGGTVKIGEWEIKMVQAFHSSELGCPIGFIIRKDKKIYHAGDTGLFGDMRLIGDEKIDIALLPIGGRYTMDIDDAIKAVDLIKPKISIPMHYNTFPVIQANPEEFKKKASSEVIVFEKGEEKEF